MVRPQPDRGIPIGQGPGEGRGAQVGLNGVQVHAGAAEGIAVRVWFNACLHSLDAAQALDDPVHFAVLFTLPGLYIQICAVFQCGHDPHNPFLAYFHGPADPPALEGHGAYQILAAADDPGRGAGEVLVAATDGQVRPGCHDLLELERLGRTIHHHGHILFVGNGHGAFEGDAAGAHRVV